MKSLKIKFNGYVTVFFLFSFLLFSMTLFADIETDALLNTKISIDAEDGSVSHIISTMAKISGCNIVLAMESASGDKQAADEKKITIHLKDVPIEQALSLVVKSIGLSYRLIGEKTFIVGEKSRIEEEIGERSYLVNLNYMDVEKAVKALEIMPGEAVGIEGQNAVLVRANPETFAEISKKISEMDVPQKQIEIRARLIEVSLTEAQKMGIDWSRLNNLTTILAENPAGAQGVGLPYSYTDDTGQVVHGGSEAFAELPQTQYFQKLDGWDNVGHFSRQLTAFDITLDFLMQNNAAQLLTDTRVTAMNGEEAEILIGEVVPFIVVDQEYRYQVEREDVGIILKVKPTVNKDGYITTQIEPQVSSVIELVGGSVPRTKVRKVTTTVTVPDGKKIIVGGLLNSSIVNTKNKIPLLGDIPFIGRLFQHRSTTIDNTDLIIEITPRVVTFEDYDYEYDIDGRLSRKLLKEKNAEDTDDELE
jgi:type IV pilus assembly protein PilQ